MEQLEISKQSSDKFCEISAAITKPSENCEIAISPSWNEGTMLDIKKKSSFIRVLLMGGF